MKKFIVAIMVAISVMMVGEPVKAFAFTSPDMIQAEDADVTMEQMEKDIVHRYVWLVNNYPYKNMKVQRIGHGITNDGHLSMTLSVVVNGEETIEQSYTDYEETLEAYKAISKAYFLGQINIWTE